MSERAQASVELLGAIPGMMLAAACLFQVLAVAAAAVFAGGAAEAGALALAAGTDVEAAARSALPRWQRAGLTVEQRGGRVSVAIRPPSLFDSLSRELEVRSSAVVRTP